MIDDPVEPLIFTNLSWEEKLHNTYWRVLLSTGDNVYSKHDRRSWRELQEWIKINHEISIVGLWFHFRDNCIEIATGSRDYIFSHVANCWYGNDIFYQFLGGYRFNENEVIVKKYRTPELLFEGDEIRPLSDPTVEKGIIWKNGSVHNHT